MSEELEIEVTASVVYDYGDVRPTHIPQRFSADPRAGTLMAANVPNVRVVDHVILRGTAPLDVALDEVRLAVMPNAAYAIGTGMAQMIVEAVDPAKADVELHVEAGAVGAELARVATPAALVETRIALSDLPTDDSGGFALRCRFATNGPRGLPDEGGWLACGLASKTPARLLAVTRALPTAPVVEDPRVVQLRALQAQIAELTRQLQLLQDDLASSS